MVLELKPTGITSSTMPDSRWILEFDEDGDLVQVQFLEASQGVDLRNIPKPEGLDFKEHSTRHNIRTLGS